MSDFLREYGEFFILGIMAYGVINAMFTIMSLLLNGGWNV